MPLIFDLIQNVSFWKDLVSRSGENQPGDNKYDDHKFCNQVVLKFEVNVFFILSISGYKFFEREITLSGP